MSDTINLCRAQRREFKRLQVTVDKAVAADRAYFARHPHREHRLRHAFAAEVAQEEIGQRETITIKPGYRAFVLVKCLCRGSRIRILVQGSDHAEVDLSEEAVRIATPKVQEAEAELRRISCGEPAAS
jgi:hypothetical protein